MTNDWTETGRDRGEQAPPPPPDQTAFLNGDPNRRGLWRRFIRWLYAADEIEAMFHRMDVIEQRVAAIEADLAHEEEKPRRGSEWETLG